MDIASKKTAPGCVSIIVPVYNSENSLDCCLKSLVGQTYSNIEVVLVDDGSTDSSWKVCLKWANADERVKVLSQSNSGPSAARNRGYLHSRGEWIWFVDSDDYIDSTSVETLISQAIEANADVAVCNFDVMNRDRVCGRDFVGLRPFPKRGNRGAECFLGDVLSRYIGNYTWQFLIKRTALDSMGSNGPFDEKLVLYEDVAFSLRLAAEASRFCYVDAVCYHYKMTKGSLVHRTDPTLARQALKAVDYLENTIVPDSLAVPKLENCLTLLLGAGITAGMGRNSEIIRAEIKGRIRAFTKSSLYKAVGTKTKIKCLCVRLGIYWRVINVMHSHH